MDARDFRSIGRSAQEELRRRALFLIEEQGLTQAQAAEIVGVQRQTVNIWLRRYRAQGDDGVLDGRRVSPRRGKGLLTADEAGKVQGWGQALIQAVARDEGRTLTAGVAVHAIPQLALASALFETDQLTALRTAGLADWLPLLAFSVGGFALAYTIWYRLLRRHPMDRVAPFALLMPVVGVAFSALALGERSSPLELAGCAVIVTGLALVVWRRPARTGRLTPARAASPPEC